MLAKKEKILAMVITSVFKGSGEGEINWSEKEECILKERIQETLEAVSSRS